MASRPRFVLNDSTWICGSLATRFLHAKTDLRMLQARGAKVFVFNEGPDALEDLKRLLWQKDSHVILSWLHPKQLAAIKPLLRDRRNFSIVVDDWWVQPYWFMREADFIIFRKYHGIAVRLGKLPFLTAGKPPVLFNPFLHVLRPSAVSTFLGASALLRPAALAISPFADAWKSNRRRTEDVRPEKYLWLPFAINCASERPVRPEKVQYDFANTSWTAGFWLMRDAFAPFHLSFANLYHDRKLVVDAIAAYENNPFSLYDCRREQHHFIPYDAYIQKSSQCRYVVATGGYHNAALPKYLEFGWLGTPIIGRAVPYEHPWLDECLFPLDAINLSPKQLKPRLDEAMDRYPEFKANCMKWREKLARLYDFNVLLDLLQSQADGKPIPKTYLRNHVATLQEN